MHFQVTQIGGVGVGICDYFQVFNYLVEMIKRSISTRSNLAALRRINF